MNRPRPHIPLSVRVKVAERQVAERGLLVLSGIIANAMLPLKVKLQQMLNWLDLKEPQLDHDPALILRKFNPRTMKYTPDANDPDFLIYREKEDHLQKTTGRKPGAERTITTKGSDIGLKTKFARLEHRKVDTSDIPEVGKGWFKKAKVKIPSRPFQKRKPGVDSQLKRR